MNGYVMLPIFTVELKDGEFEMTCSTFLAWVFELFFAPFWTGEVHILKRGGRKNGDKTVRLCYCA